VCQAVAYAHSKGVIHRDLKPENVMVGRFGEVQVMDWGLAKLLTRTGEAAEQPAGAGEAVGSRPAEVGQTCGAVGTLAYMAPEQANGEWERADERLDVFGLGGILCAVLTGQPPYVGGSAAEVRRKAQRGDLGEALARLEGCGAEPELVRLARACLCAEVGGRPRHAGEVAQALAAYQAGVERRLRQAELGRAEAHARAQEERKRRRALLALAAALLLLLVAAGAGAWLVRQKRDRQRGADQQQLLALGQARGRLEEGWQAFDLARLKEAKADADRLAELAHVGEPAEPVRQAVADFQEEAGQRLARADKSRALLVALLDVSAPQYTRTYDHRGRPRALDQPSVEEQYAAAFRRWGLDVDGTPEAEVVARLRDEPGPVLQEVIAGLDGWMLERWRQKAPERKWRRLYRVAERLDGSARGRQLRALLVERAPPPAPSVVGLLGAWPPWPALWELERGHSWRHLRQLRGQVDLAREPVLSVVLLAEALSARGDAAGANEVLRRAVVARPGQVVLLGAQGRLLERQGRLGEAIECYRAARALRPHLGVALGRALARAGRAAEGEEVCHDLVRLGPNDPEARFFLGYALQEQGKLAEAVAAYREAIRLRTDYPEAHSNLGAALQKQEKLAEAVAAYREAIRLRPNFPEAHSNLGAALASQGKLVEAVAPFREAIRLRPDFPEAHNNLGAALQSQGKQAEAVAAYRQAIRLRPDYPEAHRNLGKALTAQSSGEDCGDLPLANSYWTM
jgi:serine/threonine-protein kinase